MYIFRTTFLCLLGSVALSRASTPDENPMSITNLLNKADDLDISQQEQLLESRDQHSGYGLADQASFPEHHMADRGVGQDYGTGQPITIGQCLKEIELWCANLRTRASGSDLSCGKWPNLTSQHKFRRTLK
ncbi:hypothetical protein BJ085DRAFT_32701 [Dimargaris cristalligena]|uniref:SCP domain-containing protein n=1 Tax=Dimargaris cristalligena TaxID=215637 RepID=A0A4P9ZXC9_9FUNG|nr:hypothetical protein BJ085DRAFT_32701 [Dimargaris cristalligena]|eukprot:RKP37681.1 hypothetical protein BJ085DRAFT_32701 [Dimargaris cristalligena]